MTIEEAFKELMQSEEYAIISKTRDSLGNKYRIYSIRFRKGELKAGALVDMLIAHNYIIKANRAVKKK